MQEIVFAGLTSPGVNQVRYLLKCKKGNRQRKKDMADLPLGTKNHIGIIDEKIGVLKIGQQSKVNANTKNNAACTGLRTVITITAANTSTAEKA